MSEAKARIMKVGPVPKILAKQNSDGSWETPEDFYSRTKYRGTVWDLIVLAELRADPEDARVRVACEFVMRWSQDRSSGGFSVRGSEKKWG